MNKRLMKYLNKVLDDEAKLNVKVQLAVPANKIRYVGKQLYFNTKDITLLKIRLCKGTDNSNYLFLA